MKMQEKGPMVYSHYLRRLDCLTICRYNRPFPSSLVPLFQNESKCETFHMKMSSACSFILMQIKVIFIRMVSHLDSLWNRGTRELGNSLLQRQLILPALRYFISLSVGLVRGSNHRPPAQRTGALPTELAKRRLQKAVESTSRIYT